MQIRISEMHSGLAFGVALVIGTAGCMQAPGGGPLPPDDTVPETVPDFNAATFTNPADIDNPLFPHVVGTTRTYTAETENGTERIVIDVLDETRVILGITCRVVRDQVFLNDVIIEDTRDFFAQDDAGNVWYVGEVVDNYNYDDAGMLIDVTNEGAWEAGLDVAELGAIARPGHQMRAMPAVGDIYNQEYYPGEAEDMGEVVAANVPVTLGDGSMYTCLQIRDTSPLAPGADEFKYYAPGIGLVLEEAVGGGERVELVGVEP